jgi:hypothetical protein
VANLTFSDLQSEVFAHTGLDSTDTTNQTNVSRWLNYVQNDICARWPWPFMEGREAVVTVPDYTTGTISITSGSTTVNGVLTVFTSTMASGQYFIQFSGSNDWYKISAFTSATEITIEQAYAGTVDLSASGYIVRKIFYSLSESCDRIIDIRNWATPLKLIEVDPRTLDDLRPNPQSTNTSYGYLCWGYDASGNIQISPYPFPSDSRILELRILKRPVDSIVSLPNKYAHIIAWGAISVGFAYMRQFEFAGTWNSKVERRLDDMKAEYRMSEDRQPILRSIDSVQRSKWISLPDGYPVITS